MSFCWFKAIGSWSSSTFTWKPISSNGKHPLSQHPKFDEVSSIRWSVEKIEGTQDAEIIVIQPPVSKKEPSPLIVFPHGGPHTAFSADFLIYINTFALLGYTSVLGISFSFLLSPFSLLSFPISLWKKKKKKKVNYPRCRFNSLIFSTSR